VTAFYQVLRRLTRPAGFGSFGSFGYFDETAGVDVVDVTVNRNMLCDERMLTDAMYVFYHA
jgi:hypothetical protein